MIDWKEFFKSFWEVFITLFFVVAGIIISVMLFAVPIVLVFSNMNLWWGLLAIILWPLSFTIFIVVDEIFLEE